jgi:hypothetical protein
MPSKRINALEDEVEETRRAHNRARQKLQTAKSAHEFLNAITSGHVVSVGIELAGSAEGSQTMVLDESFDQKVTALIKSMLEEFGKE